MTDSSGAVTASYAYGPWGEPQSNSFSGSRFRYTGQIALTEASLYYYKARVYDPLYGRFLQTDPIGSKDDINLYAYVGNDPVNKADPTGTEGLADMFYRLAQVFAPPPTGEQMQDAGGTKEEVQRASLKSAQYQGAKLVTQKEAEYLPWFLGGPEEGALIKFEELVASRGVPEITLRSAAKGILRSCCFAAGTLVQTSKGLRPIEDIEVGTLVLSRDELSGRTAYKSVIKLIRHHDREIFVVRIESISDEGKVHVSTIKTTSDHPWRTTAGLWVRTVDLRPGVLLQRAEGRPARVLAITNTGSVEPTYNFEVADYHTYFVGADRVWVHNEWCAGSFETAAQSLLWHFDKHGAEVGAKDAAQYLRKAEAFAQNLRGATTRDLGDGAVRYMKNGRYIIMKGIAILSFGAITP